MRRRLFFFYPNNISIYSTNTLYFVNKISRQYSINGFILLISLHSRMAYISSLRYKYTKSYSQRKTYSTCTKSDLREQYVCRIYSPISNAIIRKESFQARKLNKRNGTQEINF